MTRSSLLLCISLAACVGHGDPHHDHTLVDVSDEPAGMNCQYGGTVISTGLDSDHDDVLDASEVTSSEYICNSSSTVKCAESATKLEGPIAIRTSADLAQLAGVSCIDGDLMIVGSDLVTIPDVTSLEVVTGGVIVAGNSMLVSLDGLPNLRDIGRRYIAQGNDSLVDISALGNLKRFAGIGIIGNDALVDVAGLDTFVEIDGGLQISNNSSMTSLHGLENLTRGTRDGIVIRSNKNLASVAALGQLRSAVLVEISGNASLPSLPLPSLEKVDVYLLVSQNAALTTLDLPSLFTTGGLLVQSNPALTSVAVPQLLLAGAVTFESDTSLTSVSAPQLSYTTVNFDLNNLPQLTQAAFPSLVAIGGPLTLQTLPQLASFGGFTNLASIGGNFTVRSCNAVTNFTGFTSLVDVANMTVSQNAELTSFTGLDSFTKVGGDLQIIANPKLPLATAQSFANGITVVGTTTIN